MSGAQDISLRPATAADHEFLQRVYAESRAEELAATAWTEAEKTNFCRAQFEAQDAHYRENYPNCQFLIIERAGQAIGRLYRDNWAQEIRIVDIALLNKERGQGVGGALMGEIIEEARGQGWIVSIHVESANPAQRLYKRLGFQCVESGEVYDFMVWQAL